MVPNAARASWINATSLMTALNLGLVAYALSAFALVVGIALIASGVTFLSLRKALIA
jgi:predicted cobalt transporter CbtA